MGRAFAGRKNSGKEIITIISASILFLLMLVTFSHAVNIKAGEDAPGFILNSVDEQIISLEDLKGKTVVFIYWRPDQKRSHLALQDGQYISGTFKDKGVEVLGFISKHDKMEEIQKIIKDNEINFPVLLDSYKDVYSDYGIRVYPTTIIIDKTGKVAYKVPGHALTYKITLEAHLKYLLGEINEEQLKEMISPRKEKADESALKAERIYNLALKFAGSGLLDNAVEAVQKSIEAGPDIAKGYILYGALLLRQEEVDLAIENFSKALELEPSSHNAKTGLGSSLLLKGDIDGAIAALEEASVANPYPATTLYELGKAYELKGDKDKSLELYKKALEKTFKNNILSFTGSH
jgi:tetratricopeptide (TPR) repeat protein